MCTARIWAVTAAKSKDGTRRLRTGRQAGIAPCSPRAPGRAVERRGHRAGQTTGPAQQGNSTAVQRHADAGAGTYEVQRAKAAALPVRSLSARLLPDIVLRTRC